MPRPPRLAIPDVPLHIVQRGVNKQACFSSTRDFGVYLNALEKTSKHYIVNVHAFALMTNHIHLLVTPRKEMAASRMMQQIGRQYVSYFNRMYGRTGTLWEGRFRSSPILTDKYLLACYRYIERNPVRAGMVDAPGRYRWSSYRSNALGRPSSLLTPHTTWMSLGSNPDDRRASYLRLFLIGNTAEEDNLIRMGGRRGRSVG